MQLVEPVNKVFWNRALVVEQLDRRIYHRIGLGAGKIFVHERNFWNFVKEKICSVFFSSCGDNIDYGYQFSRDFVDTPEKETDSNTQSSAPTGLNQTEISEPLQQRIRRNRIRRQMNLHNNEVGRRVSLIKIDLDFYREIESLL